MMYMNVINSQTLFSKYIIWKARMYGYKYDNMLMLCQLKSKQLTAYAII